MTTSTACLIDFAVDILFFQYRACIHGSHSADRLAERVLHRVWVESRHLYSGLVCFDSTLFLPLLGLQAYLLQFSGTKLWRLALLPLICFSSIRYATRYTTGAPLLDIIFIGVIGAYGVMKSLEWSLCSLDEYRWMGKEPLSRLGFAHELMSNMRYAFVSPLCTLLTVSF